MAKNVFYVYGYFGCMYISVPCACHPWKPEKGIESLGTGVTDDYKLLCGFWELNMGPLGENRVLWIAELSLQPSEMLLTSMKYCSSVTNTWSRWLFTYWPFFVLFKVFAVWQRADGSPYWGQWDTKETNTRAAARSQEVSLSSIHFPVKGTSSSESRNCLYSPWCCCVPNILLLDLGLWKGSLEHEF